MMEMAQVGVRTRARAALALAAAAAASTTSAATSATTKKRKVNNDDLKLSIKLRRARSNRPGRVFTTPENNSSLPSPPPPEINSDHVSVIEDRCSSPSSDHASASCCSCNYYGSSERIIKFADLEERSVEVETSMYYTCRERRETTPSSEVREESSEELDSTARLSSEANSHSRLTALEKMPTDEELEDFFVEAEKNLQKQFAEKYNYDILKDEPLEGRYEWVRLKP